MRFIGRLTMLGLLAVLISAPSLRAQDVSRVLAVVGDEVITTLDVEKTMRMLEQQMAGAARPGELARGDAQLRRLALERLVEEKIFEREVAREKINVGKEEVEAYIERVRKSNNLSEAELEAQLSRRGLTMEEYRQELRKDILKHRLLERHVKSKVVISDAQVEKAYQAMYGGGADSNMVRFRALFLQVAPDAAEAVEQAVKQRAEGLRKQAAGGADFADLARKNSQGPGAEQGGELGPLSTSDLLPAMRQALADLKPGALSPVVRVPSGFVFMQLIDKGAALAGSPSADLKEQIRIKLENEALEKRFQEWIKDLRAKVYVRVIE